MEPPLNQASQNGRQAPPFGAISDLCGEKSSSEEGVVDGARRFEQGEGVAGERG